MTDYLDDITTCGRCNERVYSMYGHARPKSNGEMNWSCEGEPEVPHMRFTSEQLKGYSVHNLRELLEHADKNFAEWVKTENTNQINEWSTQYNRIEEELISRGEHV